MPINPVSSYAMGSAAGDLGLAASTQNEAKAIADKLKKKKMQDEQAQSKGVPGSAMSDLLNGTF